MEVVIAIFSLNCIFLKVTLEFKILSANKNGYLRVSKIKHSYLTILTNGLNGYQYSLQTHKFNILSIIRKVYLNVF